MGNCSGTPENIHQDFADEALELSSPKLAAPAQITEPTAASLSKPVSEPVSKENTAPESETALSDAPARVSEDAAPESETALSDAPAPVSEGVESMESGVIDNTTKDTELAADSKDDAKEVTSTLLDLEPFKPMPCVTLRRPGGKPSDGAGRDHKAAAKAILTACKTKITPSVSETIAVVNDIARESSVSYRRDGLQALYYLTRVFPDSSLITEMVCVGALKLVMDIMTSVDDHKVRHWGVLVFVNLMHKNEKPQEDIVRVAHRYGGFQCILTCFERELKSNESLNEKLGIYQQSAVVLSALLSTNDYNLCLSKDLAEILRKTLENVEKEVNDPEYTDFAAKVLNQLATVSTNVQAKCASDSYITSASDAALKNMNLMKKLDENISLLVSEEEARECVESCHKHNKSSIVIQAGFEACLRMLEGPHYEKLKQVLVYSGLQHAATEVLTFYSTHDSHACKESSLKILILLCENDAAASLSALTTEHIIIYDNKKEIDTKSLFKTLLMILKSYSKIDDTINREEQKYIILPTLKLIHILSKHLNFASFVTETECEDMRIIIYRTMGHLRDSQELLKCGSVALESLAASYEVYGQIPWVYTEEELEAKKEKDLKDHEVYLNVMTEAAKKRTKEKAEKKAKEEAEKKAKEEAEKKAKEEDKSTESGLTSEVIKDDASKDDDEGEEDHFESDVTKPIVSPPKKIEETKLVAAAAPPEGGAWQVRKCARKGGILSRNLDRWLVLNKGTLKYYDMKDKSATPDISPYIKDGAVPKNELKSEIIGCRAEKWFDQFDKAPPGAKSKRRSSVIGGDDANTIQVHVPEESDEFNLIVQFQDGLKTHSFLKLFEEHVTYYTANRK